MSTHGTDRGDDDLMRHYRAASAVADEQPVASARASILAAAARQAHAKPVDAKQPYRRARWPLAAAAAVMLSTLAVMLAIRTSEEMPQFGAPQELGSANPAPAAPASEPLPQQQKAVEETQLQSQPAREQRESRAGSASQAADGTSEPKRALAASERAKTETTDRPTENRANESRVRESARAPAAASPPAAPSPSSPAPVADAAAPPPPASAPAPLAKQRAEADAASQRFGQSAGAVKPNEPQPTQAPAAAASAERGSDTRRDAARTLPSASRAVPAQAARDEAEGSAATWLERIIRLRREGRHDEAEAELKRFRERYPQVQVPPQALAPAVRP